MPDEIDQAPIWHGRKDMAVIRHETIRGNTGFILLCRFAKGFDADIRDVTTHHEMWSMVRSDRYGERSAAAIGPVGHADLLHQREVGLRAAEATLLHLRRSQFKHSSPEWASYASTKLVMASLTRSGFSRMRKWPACSILRKMRLGKKSGSLSLQTKGRTASLSPQRMSVGA